MKRTELKRKTPLRSKPTSKPAKPRKPIRKAKPTVARAQLAQRKALKLRSEGRCEMERPLKVLKTIWFRCRYSAVDAAHIYGRPKCGRARDLPEVVVHACRECHDRFDGRLEDGSLRRAPLRYAQAAWDSILQHSKLGTGPERLRIHIGSVGERPARGVGIYA